MYHVFQLQRFMALLKTNHGGLTVAAILLYLFQNFVKVSVLSVDWLQKSYTSERLSYYDANQARSAPAVSVYFIG